jgi:membrane protease subunit HflK
MSSENPWDSSNGKSNWKKKKVIGGFRLNLDEILKKIIGEQKNAGNGRNSGNDGDDDGSIPTFSTGMVLPALAVLCLMYLSTGFYQVEHDECGVVLRFGRYVRTVGPGWDYILPRPFDDVILQKATAINQIDIGFVSNNQQQEENLMLTGDSNLANISFSVLWKIKDDGIRDYLFNAKSPETTVKAVAESVMREIVGQTPFTYVQTNGRADVQKKARKNLQALMDEYKIGVEVVSVKLQRVEPPASVIDSFRDVERAQAEQQSEKNKAEAYDLDKKQELVELLRKKSTTERPLSRK